MIPRKLNIGCGKDKKEGYLNVDIIPDVKPDMVVPCLPERQPFEDEQFDEVLAHGVSPYIKITQLIPTLQELCRIGKKVLINFSPINGSATKVFEIDHIPITYSISDLRNLDYRKRKGDDWIARDYNLKINKAYFTLHFEKYFPFNIIKKIVNKSEKTQDIYQKSFLMYIAPPQNIWLELELAKRERK